MLLESVSDKRHLILDYFLSAEVKNLRHKEL